MKLESRKKTEHMGVLVIRHVVKDVARELIVKGHYSHKWQATFGLHNFGIFREGAEADEDCLGVADDWQAVPIISHLFTACFSNPARRYTALTWIW